MRVRIGFMTKFSHGVPMPSSEVRGCAPFDVNFHGGEAGPSRGPFRLEGNLPREGLGS